MTAAGAIGWPVGVHPPGRGMLHRRRPSRVPTPSTVPSASAMITRAPSMTPGSAWPSSASIRPHRSLPVAKSRPTRWSTTGYSIVWGPPRSFPVATITVSVAVASPAMYGCPGSVAVQRTAPEVELEASTQEPRRESTSLPARASTLPIGDDHRGGVCAAPFRPSAAGAPARGLGRGEAHETAGPEADDFAADPAGPEQAPITRISTDVGSIFIRRDAKLMRF